MIKEALIRIMTRIEWHYYSRHCLICQCRRWCSLESTNWLAMRATSQDWYNVHRCWPGTFGSIRIYLTNRTRHLVAECRYVAGFGDPFATNHHPILQTLNNYSANGCGPNTDNTESCWYRKTLILRHPPGIPHLTKMPEALREAMPPRLGAQGSSREPVCSKVRWI